MSSEKPNKLLVFSGNNEDEITQMVEEVVSDNAKAFEEMCLCHNLGVVRKKYYRSIVCDNLDDLEKNLKLAKNLGFEGMLILNPKELPLCHYYFSPSEEEVIWAKEMVELAEEAVCEGKGVAVKEGKFIGPPMVKMAKNIMAKYNQICKYNNNK